MKILVTGANGMLGRDLCPVLKKIGHEVIETDKSNLDITNIAQVEEFLLKEKPEILIHCAAYTNVDKAEEDIDLAQSINVQGTQNIAKMCKFIDCTMVYISTDYVFDGEKNIPYTTTDTPNPINNYGKTKFLGEKVVTEFCPKHFIIRTSWLYGQYGKNFVETMISLSKNDEIKVVNDQVGCPTWTVDLANAITNLINNNKYGVYHICGSNETSWYEYAKEIFRQMNLNVNVVPCSSIEFNRKAQRPKYSVLNNSLMCRDWKEALREYLTLRESEGR